MSCVIDPDDPDTWPSGLRRLVENQAALLIDTAKYAVDLRPAEAASEEIEDALRGHSLRAYHATRLLDHEVEAIQKQGLRRLTSSLIEERLAAAAQHGAITSGVHETLAGSTVFARNFQTEIREGLLWFFLGSSTFSDDGGLWRLLETWGGEGIYWMIDKGSQTEQVLRGLGTPSIVVAAVPDPLQDGSFMSPSLSNVLIGTVLGIGDVSSGLHLRADLPPKAIHDIWQPGHPEFNRLLPWVDTD